MALRLWHNVTILFLFLHPVFHVSLLRPYPADAVLCPAVPMPLLLDKEGDWYEATRRAADGASI
jgi:hypothetical protein